MPRGGEALILGALLVVPLACTLYWNSFRVNLVAGAAFLLLAALRRPTVSAHWFRAPRRTWLGVGVVAVGLVLVSWQWHHGDLWLNSQFLLYLGIVLAFPALVAWFRETGPTGLGTLFSVKLGAVVGASLLVLVASLLVSDEIGPGRLSVRDDTVIYRHLRHFNYDQVAVVLICAWWAAAPVSRLQSAASFGVLMLTGYLLGVTGGRGAIIAITLFLGTLAVFRAVPLRTMLSCALALAGGLLVSIALGQADNLLVQVERTITGSNIASNRLALWSGSLTVWLESWQSMLVGFGPDALRTYVRREMGYPPNVQAHNAFVQVLIEFGLVGLIAFLGLLTIIARRALALLTSPAATSEAKICCAALGAFGAYMLVDGIVYHALPLAFVTILVAYVFSRPVPVRGTDSVARHTAPASSQFRRQR